MSRKIERILIGVVSLWHFINAVLTILVFGMDMKHNGTELLANAYPSLKSVSSSLVDNVYIVLSTYGLFIMLIGIMNVYLLKFLKDNEINIKWQIWMIVLLMLSVLTMDFISILFYSIIVAIYNSKNKAIRAKEDIENQVLV